MVRPHKPAGTVKVTRISVRSTVAFRDHFADLARKAGHPDLGSYLEWLAAKEAKRLKLPPPPPR